MAKKIDTKVKTRRVRGKVGDANFLATAMEYARDPNKTVNNPYRAKEGGGRGGLTPRSKTLDELEGSNADDEDPDDWR